MRGDPLHPPGDRWIAAILAALVALILATPATATGPTRHSLVQFAFADRSDASSIVVHGSQGECERRRCWVRIKFKLNPVDEWARCSALLVIRPRTWNVARSDCPWALNAQKPADR